VPRRAADLLRHLVRFAEVPDPDAELLDRFAHRKDESAFAALVGRYGPLVLHVCRRVLADVHDAEDAFQATFLVLARKAASVRRPASLAAFLHGVAHRVACKARTAAARRRRYEVGATPAAPPPDPLAQVTAREMLALLDEEVARLPQAYRLPVLLCCLEGLSQEEAARQLGWTAGSVKGRLERGRRMLHRRLARRGLALTTLLAGAEVSRALAAGVAGALVDSTANAAARFVAGQGAAAGVSSEVVALAGGVLRGMVLSRMSLLAAVVLALSVAAGIGLAVRQRGPDPEAPQPAQPVAAPRTDAGGDALPEGVIARLGTLRFRGVRGSLTFSPDGRLLATAGGPAGERITLWDRATGRAVRTFGDNATLQTLASSPDGLLLVSAGNERHSRVWDVARGEQRFQIPGAHAALGPDGKTLVSADSFGAGSKVHVCDAATGRVLRQWPLDNGAKELVVSGDGRSFAVVDHANPSEVVVRDTTSGAKLGTIRLEGAGVAHLALSPDGKTLATAHNDGVRLWDPATGKQVRHWAQRADSRPVFSRDGKLLAWTGYNGIARVWVVARDGDTPRAVGEPTNNFEAPALSPDGKVLAVLTDANVVRLREVAGGKDVFALPGHTSPILGVHFTADGRGVVSRDRESVCAWDAADGRLIHRTPSGETDRERLLALLAGGRLLTEERPANIFRVRDGQTGREVFRFAGRADVGETAVAPGDRYAAVHGPAGEVCVLDLHTAHCTHRFEPAGGAFGPRLSADGDVFVWHRRVAAGLEVFVRHLTHGKTFSLGVLREDDELRRWLANGRCLSPDGRWLLVPVADGSLRRWDLATGKELSRLPEAQRTIWGLFWSPDGRLAAARGSASPPTVIDHEARRDVRLWDVAAGKRLAPFELADAPESVLFSGDGRTLLTTDMQGIIHIWEVTTGQERRRLPGHLPGAIGALAFSPDGRRLASGGYDGQVLVWDLTGRMPNGQWRTTRHSAEQTGAWWEALAGAHAGRACEAMWALTADPEGTVALLRERLQPVVRPDAEQLRRWIAELDHDDFAVRQQAERQLESIGDAAVTELREALKRVTSAEAKRRLRRLIEDIERPAPTGKRLQELRAVEVLESIGTAEARKVLQALAGGPPESRLTQEAGASLQRLKRGKDQP
jgi:RNA polymerase sigma factor (sigma-70 family)